MQNITLKFIWKILEKQEKLTGCFSTATTHKTERNFEIMTNFVFIKVIEVWPKPGNQINTY